MKKRVSEQIYKGYTTNKKMPIIFLGTLLFINR